MYKLLSYRRGQMAVIFVFICIICLIGIYYSNNWFNQRNYINFYDGSTIRKFDIPPYSDRITPVDYELLGICDIKIRTTADQANDFFATVCSDYGYKLITSNNTGKITIKIHNKYSIVGEYSNELLKLRWTPILTPTLKTQAEKLPLLPDTDTNSTSE